MSEHVRRTGDSAVPWGRVPGLADEFGTPDDVLRELHRRWYTRFFARLDALLEEPPADMVGAVAALWDELTAEDPARRAILDAYRDHPALAAATKRQRQLVALAIGDANLACLDDGQPQTRRAVYVTSSSSRR